MKPGRFPTVHPLLVCAYPILYLYGANIGKMSAWEMLVPLVIAWAVAGTIWLSVAGVFRDVRFGAIVATLFVILFLVTIPAFRFIKGFGVPKYMALACLAAVIAAGAGLLVWKRRELGWLSTFLNIGATVACVVLLATIVPKALAVPASPMGTREIAFEPTPGAARPDIYYLLLDGYGRSDVLEELYSFDNTSFIRTLEGLGFYVASNSAANYPQTLLSLSSTLNMTYLDELARRVGPLSQDRAPLQNLVTDSQLVLSLKGLGYRFVSFSSGFSGTQNIRHVDRRMAPRYELTEFQNLLLSLSPVPAILENLPLPSLSHWQFDAHRQRIRYIFDELGRLPRTSTPQFVFAHVLSPHPPFVFGPEGQPLDPATDFSFDDASHYMRHSTVSGYVRGYANQARYVSASVAKAVAAILEGNPEAVIIVQGDHGPGAHLDWNSYEKSNMRERLAILNAYRVPADMKAALYPRISPVNTFRLLLNHLFGSTLTRLEDEAYFAPWRLPFNFRNVTAEVHAPDPSSRTPRDQDPAAVGARN